MDLTHINPFIDGTIYVLETKAFTTVEAGKIIIHTLAQSSPE